MTMALTGLHHAFVGAHEDAMNVIIDAFRVARPWYFSFGTSMLGGGAPPVPTTLIKPIDMPGTYVGFQYRIDFADITIDCFPPESGSGLPAELAPLNTDEFSLRVDVNLSVLCPRVIVALDEVHEWESLESSLTVWVAGSPTATPAGGGATQLGLMLHGVEIVDIKPEDLENVLECFLMTILEQAVLPKLTFVLDKLSTDFFTLALVDGPHVDSNRIFALGDVL
jgi:hypothetical protein